jgi:hypothetical protein
VGGSFFDSPFPLSLLNLHLFNTPAHIDQALDALHAPPP